MPFYEFKCQCGLTREVEAHMGEAPGAIECKCGKMARRVYRMPNVSLNKWNVDYAFNDVSAEIDGERDAIAAGCYE